MTITSAQAKFDSYPNNIGNILLELRSLILLTAEQHNLGKIEETLKWGEPAYLVKGGSTIRIDWKPKQSNRIFIYFNCKTTLVETFKEIYFDILSFEGNRAIVLNISQKLPLDELSECILMSLTYQKIKHLPLLGYQ